MLVKVQGEPLGAYCQFPAPTFTALKSGSASCVAVTAELLNRHIVDQCCVVPAKRIGAGNRDRVRAGGGGETHRVGRIVWSRSA